VVKETRAALARPSTPVQLTALGLLFHAELLENKPGRW
jgi:hypothetical protein